MFTVRKIRNSLIITTQNTNRINLLNINQLRKQFILALQTPCVKIILDLQQINFIDSTSFEVIDEMVNIAEQHHVSFAFANLCADVTEIFSLIPNASNYHVENEISIVENNKAVFAQ